MEDRKVEFTMNPQRLHTFSLKSPARNGLFQDDLVMRVASQIVMHIEELVSLSPGRPSYVYNLPEGLRWPEACRIVEKHLRENCDAPESVYDDRSHCIVVRASAVITDARERVAAEQRTAPIHDGKPMVQTEEAVEV